MCTGLKALIVCTSMFLCLQLSIASAQTLDSRVVPGIGSQHPVFEGLVSFSMLRCMDYLPDFRTLATLRNYLGFLLPL